MNDQPFKRTCRECGGEYQAKRDTSAFCAPKCRQAWNNRRMIRGAELYDLFMELRFNRKSGNVKRLWTLICAVASAYRDADKALRAGRQSWDAQAYQRIPLAYSTDGDGR